VRPKTRPKPDLRRTLGVAWGPPNPLNVEFPSLPDITQSPNPPIGPQDPAPALGATPFYWGLPRAEAP
jgi:hypothetical protein